jgi:hypothetical protein
MCQLAWRGGCSEGGRIPQQRRPCDRRDTKRSDWRDGRDAASTSGLRGPASGMAGGRGGDLAGQARSAVDQDRPVRQAGPFTRSVKEAGPRAPRARESRAPKPCVQSTPDQAAQRRPRGACLGGPRHARAGPIRDPTNFTETASAAGPEHVGPAPLLSRHKNFSLPTKPPRRPLDNPFHTARSGRSA